MNAIDDVVHHNSWATARLIEHIRSLPPPTLELSAPGTFGTIGATLAHILGAERAYLARLRGRRPHLARELRTWPSLQMRRGRWARNSSIYCKPA